MMTKTLAYYKEIFVQLSTEVYCQTACLFLLVCRWPFFDTRFLLQEIFRKLRQLITGPIMVIIRFRLHCT